MCFYVPWVYSCFDSSQTTYDEQGVKIAIKGAHGWKLGLVGGWNEPCEDFPNCEKTATTTWQSREEIPHRCKTCIEKRRAELRAELYADMYSGSGQDSATESSKEPARDRDFVRGSARVEKPSQRKSTQNRSTQTG